MSVSDQALEEIKQEFFANCKGAAKDEEGVTAWIVTKFDDNLRDPLDRDLVSWSDPRIRKFSLSVAAGMGRASALEADRANEPITATITDRVWRRLVYFWQQINPVPAIDGISEWQTITNQSREDIVICSCPK